MKIYFFTIWYIFKSFILSIIGILTNDKNSAVHWWDEWCTDNDVRVGWQAMVYRSKGINP